MIKLWHSGLYTLILKLMIEPRQKLDFCLCKKKGADQLCTFVFATQIVQFLFFSNPKFQVSSHLLWLYRTVVSDLVGNPKDRFSHVAAQIGLLIEQ